MASSLRIHINTHAGDKSYFCKQCDFAFLVASSLRIHINTHAGDKSYFCKQYDFAFKLASSLRIHIKTHSICYMNRKVTRSGELSLLTLMSLILQLSQRGRSLDQKYFLWFEPF